MTPPKGTTSPGEAKGPATVERRHLAKAECFVTGDTEAIAQALADAEQRGKEQSAQLRQDGQGWVSVEERLPDSDLYVLCWRPGKLPLIAQHEITDDSEGTGEDYWELPNGEPVALAYFTHWRPLPSPPSGGG